MIVALARTSSLKNHSVPLSICSRKQRPGDMGNPPSNPRILESTCATLVGVRAASPLYTHCPRSCLSMSTCTASASTSARQHGLFADHNRHRKACHSIPRYFLVPDQE